MGALLWKRRVREDLRTFVPTKSIQIPLSSHFSERGLVHQKKWKVSGGVIGLLNDGLSGIELAKAGSSHLVNVGVLASLFVVISSLRDKSHRYDAMWARIAMRVAGSWIAASGLFMLGGAGELKWF
jgi:hypothetical protein